MTLSLHSSFLSMMSIFFQEARANLCALGGSVTFQAILRSRNASFQASNVRLIYNKNADQTSQKSHPRFYCDAPEREREPE